MVAEFQKNSVWMRKSWQESWKIFVSIYDGMICAEFANDFFQKVSEADFQKIIIMGGNPGTQSEGFSALVSGVYGLGNFSITESLYF